MESPKCMNQLDVGECHAEAHLLNLLKLITVIIQHVNLVKTRNFPSQYIQMVISVAVTVVTSPLP